MSEQVVETPVKNDYSSLEQAMGIKSPTVSTPAAEKKEEVVVTPEATAKPEEKKEETPAEKKEVINIDNLTDDEINNLIEKRTGKKVSLADLTKPEQKTPEEIEKAAQKRNSDALAWAIESGEITKEQYDAAIVGKSKTDRDIALALFTADALADDKDLTPEECEEMFKDAYHETDDTTKLYKVGQKEIKKLADAYREKNFGVLDEIGPKYDETVQTQDRFKAYKSTVKKVADEMPKEIEVKQMYKYLDGKEEEITYKIPVNEKVLASLVKDASSLSSFQSENFFNEGKFDEKQQAKKLSYHLKAQSFDEVIAEVIKQTTKEVETRMEVVLGNKRNGAPELNNGRQEINRKPNKTNTYSSLEQHMANRR